MWRFSRIGAVLSLLMWRSLSCNWAGIKRSLGGMGGWSEGEWDREWEVMILFIILFFLSFSVFLFVFSLLFPPLFTRLYSFPS